MGEGFLGGRAAGGLEQASQGTQRSTQESRDQEAGRKKLARKKEGYPGKAISLEDRSNIVTPRCAIAHRDAPLESTAVELMEENERPETGSRPGLSDAGANGSQQERRKMRVIGRLRCGIARRLRCFGAADRRRARGRRSRGRRERSHRCLRLRAGIAAAA